MVSLVFRFLGVVGLGFCIVGCRGPSTHEELSELESSKKKTQMIIETSCNETRNDAPHNPAKFLIRIQNKRKITDRLGDDWPEIDPEALEAQILVKDGDQFKLDRKLFVKRKMAPPARDKSVLLEYDGDKFHVGVKMYPFAVLTEASKVKAQLDDGTALPKDWQCRVGKAILKVKFGE